MKTKSHPPIPNETYLRAMKVGYDIYYRNIDGKETRAELREIIFCWLEGVRLLQSQLTQAKTEIVDGQITVKILLSLIKGQRSPEARIARKTAHLFLKNTKAP